MAFKVAIAQVSPKLGDLAANLLLYEEKLRLGAKQGADLVLFPELSLTGYFLRDMVPSVALKLASPEIERLKKLSRETAFVAGLVEEGPDYRFYNAAVYFDRGEVRHVHRKVYLPTYGMFDEQRYFARGDRVRAFDTRFGRLALLVCEDLWHPSTIYLAALDGALAVLCPSTSPLRGVTEGAAQDDNARYWEMLNRAYAETFSLFMIYGNRVGFEDGVGFWGGSEVVDPFGRRTAKAKYYEEDFIVADVALEAVRRKRTASPLLRDEDIDLTINELTRIRERPPNVKRIAGLKGLRVIKGMKGAGPKGKNHKKRR
ncbi:MAG TPA: nitrilase-related carbon-nitrogen hydrolase [Candidatus Binatia bacterium]